MKEYKIRARFKEFSLPENACHENSSAAIPTVRGTLKMRYGAHMYYFLNFKEKKGIRVRINHFSVLKFGIKRFLDAHYDKEKHIFKLKYLFKSFHYGMSLIEQLFLSSAPHTAGFAGDGKYTIGMWSYYCYFLIDCKNKKVVCRVTDNEENHIFGTHQWFDRDTDELYYMTYSMEDSLKRCIDPYSDIYCKVMKRDNKTGKSTEIWSGSHTDYLHDISVNQTKEYCVIPEFGLYLDENDKMIPSKALVIDLKKNQHWVVDDLKVAAHVQFDPAEPDVFYLSNHNFKIVPKNLLWYLTKGRYCVEFYGPGSITKHRITKDGPVQIGEFTDENLFRVFDHEIFYHRGRKIIAVIGFPDSIFIADAESLEVIKILKIKEEPSIKHFYRKIPCAVGTISPSLNGEKIYVQNRYSFQVIDIDSGEADWRKSYFFSHSSTNHMITSGETAW